MTEEEAGDEHENAAQNGIEEVEASHGGDTYHEEERPFDTKISEGLMQAFEHSIASFRYRHNPPLLRQFRSL
jgi:hypothetical protein